MDSYQWPVDLRTCKLKTARQKKRLQKEDSDKQLIQLYKRNRALWECKKNLPMVPLPEPYQKGWKRTFILRHDLQRSKYAGFYTQLLGKINTVSYANNKAFTKRTKRRRKNKKVYEDIKQILKEYSVWEWNHPKLTLTEQEKCFFHPESFWDADVKKYEIKYVFDEPWRYVLQVRPHMVCEARMVDNVLEQEISELNNYLASHNLEGRMFRLTNGRKQWHRRHAREKKWQANPLKNKALHTILDECKNEQETTK